MEVRRAKLIERLIVCVLISFTVHLLSYLYYSDDARCSHGYMPENTKVSLFRISMYLTIWLFSELILAVLGKFKFKMFFYIVCSICGLLIFNELVKRNQHWGIWEGLGFIASALHPCYKKLKIKK